MNCTIIPDSANFLDACSAVEVEVLVPGSLSGEARAQRAGSA